jgi:hypothetical protein
MTFTEWYNDLEARHDANYGGYEDLLEECWYAAQEALIAMQQEHIEQQKKLMAEENK